MILKNTAGYTIAYTNIVEFADREKAVERLKEELLTVRPRPASVDKIGAFIRFATDKLKISEEQVGKFSNVHYSFIGNLSPVGYVHIGKVIKSDNLSLLESTKDLNYSVLVTDISSPLVWTNELFVDVEPEIVLKLEEWLGYSGLIHRAAIIRKVCRVLNCKTMPMENKNIDSIEDSPSINFIQPIIVIGR